MSRGRAPRSRFVDTERRRDTEAGSVPNCPPNGNQGISPVNSGIWAARQACRLLRRRRRMSDAPGDRLAGTGDRHRPEWPIGMAGIRTFDGHVHRIMGDAVMAYFGRVGSAPEQGVVDALNCSAALQYFTEYVVVPRLEQEGFTESEFGIRVGVDFGPKDNVLWAAYGYPGIEEVTATSFHVDSAAKLQHAAGRNQVMLGQSLVEFMDYPKELVSTKTSTRGAEKVEEPYLTPNHTDASGKPKNYRQ